MEKHREWKLVILAIKNVSYFSLQAIHHDGHEIQPRIESFLAQISRKIIRTIKLIIKIIKNQPQKQKKK